MVILTIVSGIIAVTAVICSTYLLKLQISNTTTALVTAIEANKAKNLAELAQYQATKSQQAVQIEMLRDTFAKEMKESGEPIQPITPRIVHDINGIAYNANELEVM